MSSRYGPERTEVWYGAENIYDKASVVHANIQFSCDYCFDRNAACVATNTSLGREYTVPIMIQLKEKNVKQRYITEITQENITCCKELSQYVEMRHLNGIKGNFAIADGESYVGTANKEGQLPAEFIFSNVKSFVDQQQYFFDMLWDKAIPAKLKFIEIEEGIVPEVIETINDPAKIMHLYEKLLGSAKNEILAIFPTTSHLARGGEQFHIIKSSLNKVNESNTNNKNIQVKILTPYDQAIREIMQELSNKNRQQQQQKRNEPSIKSLIPEQLGFNQSIIKVRYIEPHLQTKVLLLIVDKQYCLAVELRDGANNESSSSFLDSIGLATYSNSKATVTSIVSIFEVLWNQVELDEKLKESYKLLELANEQLKLNDIMQKEFIGIAAHELKTPIQPIMGLSEVMRTRVTNEEQRKLLDIIIRNANRLQHLAEALLDVSKIESGVPIRLFKTDFAIYDLIESIIEDIKSKSQSANIQISLLDNIDKDFIIHADKDRLSQIIINLLNNAIKFTSEDEKMISLSLAKKGNHDIIISIKDTGTGIDPEVLPRLFSKFVSKSKKGTGLGLYLSKALVEAHGGRMWAENNSEGKGATFYFTIPVRNANE